MTPTLKKPWVKAIGYGAFVGLIFFFLTWLSVTVYYCRYDPQPDAAPNATAVNPCYCLPNGYLICNSGSAWDAQVQQWLLHCTLPANTTLVLYICTIEPLSMQCQVMANVTSPLQCAEGSDKRCKGYIGGSIASGCCILLIVFIFLMWGH